MAGLPAKKITKFRKSPSAFFSDSRKSWLRSMGRWLAPRLEGSDYVMDLLEHPTEALKNGALAPLIGALESRRRKQRLRKISDAGTPCISVIMPAHNAADCITAAIDSVLAQSYLNTELVVVDDASQDDTAARVRQRAAHDSRVRLVQHDEQRGAGLARNTGLANAKGHYLTFHDADDTSHPERLERQLGALLETPGSALCICNFRRETPDGKRVIINGNRFGKNVLSMMFPRDPVFEKVGYMLDIPVGEDSEYYERIRAVFGQRSEVHLFQTLYRARFVTDSLLFTHGKTSVSADGRRVTHERSARAEGDYQDSLARVARIASGDLEPYVPCSGKAPA